MLFAVVLVAVAVDVRVRTSTEWKGWDVGLSRRIGFCG